jgi:hypothetical protein
LLVIQLVPAEAEPLRYDPFREPEPPVIEENAASRAESAGLDDDWRPRLKATMRSKGNDLANVDGYLIEVGATYQGYRLVAVSERTAIFAQDDDRIVLSMDETPDDAIDE